jgi:hypothetical protein
VWYGGKGYVGAEAEGGGGRGDLGVKYGEPSGAEYGELCGAVLLGGGAEEARLGDWRHVLIAAQSERAVGDAASLATEAAKLLLSLGVRKEPTAAWAPGSLDQPPGAVESLDGFEEEAWGVGGTVAWVLGVDRGGGTAVGGAVGEEEAEGVGGIEAWVLGVGGGGGAAEGGIVGEEAAERVGDFGWYVGDGRSALALVVLFEEEIEDGSHGVERPKEMEPNWVGGEYLLNEVWALSGVATRKAFSGRVHLPGEDALAEFALVPVEGFGRAAGV